MATEFVGEHGPELIIAEVDQGIHSALDWKTEYRDRREAGWYSFGTHVSSDARLEFDGEDETGLPLWERLISRTPSVYERVILIALSRLGKHVYGGTVSRADVTARRRKNRVARKSRRVNRD